MTRILLAFALLFTSTCLAQEVECQYAPSANFTGTCESFYSNGNIRSQTDFSDGLRDGSHKEYYMNGQVAASATFDQETYIGEIYRYSPKGTVIFEMELDSNETGTFIYFNDDGKSVLTSGRFKKGFRDGHWKFYDENGKLIRTETFDGEQTWEEVYGDETAKEIYIPYAETIDQWFLEEYGLPIEIKAKTIVDFPDVPAEFDGGAEEMKAFIQKNVDYPRSALEDGEHGKVYVSFVVELDGSISNIKIMKGVCESLDQEALRLVNLMSNWKPGTYNGQNVRSKCYLPITFTLEIHDD
ncbi:MAG: TonB family protein [Crocinitomicaceae bacterium]|nr:TonB family protein [Crocinitomicaceae bacterium]